MIEQIHLQHLIPKGTTTPSETPRVGAVEVTRSFGQFLSDALQSVENQKQEADLLTSQFITGQISDVHSVMISAEKAALALELTVQVRNKMIEAYQEIMRIQL